MARLGLHVRGDEFLHGWVFAVVDEVDGENFGVGAVVRKVFDG